jgi:F-type H+-transporting ATPase subunit alpha
MKDIEIENIHDFERDFLKFMDENYAQVGKDIVAKGSLTADNEEDLKEAIGKFKAASKKEYILDSQQVMNPHIPDHEPEAQKEEEK